MPAAAAPRYDIAAIKSRLPMLDLCRREGMEFEESGVNWIAHCCFHAGRRKTFTIHGDSPGHFKCYSASCGLSGDILEFWQQRHHVAFAEAARALAEIAGVAPMTDGEKRTPRKPAEKKARGLSEKPILPELRPLTDDEQARLAERRGVSLAAAQRVVTENVVLFAYWPVGENGEPDSRSRAAWVVTDDSGWTAAFRRMDGEEWFEGCKSWAVKNSRWPVGIANLRGRRDVLLVEGGPDLLAAWHIVEMHSAADRVAVVAMLGGAATIAQEAIKELKGCRVRIFADNDAPTERRFAKAPPVMVCAGMEAAARWLWQLRDAGISADVVNLGALGREGVKDLNNLVAGGLEGLDTAALLWGPATPGLRPIPIMELTRPQRCRAVEWRALGAVVDKSAAAGAVEVPGKHRGLGSKPAAAPKSRKAKVVQKPAGAGADTESAVDAGGGDDGIGFDPQAICEEREIWRENRKDGAFYFKADDGEIAAASKGELGDVLAGEGNVRMKANFEAGERVSEYKRLIVYIIQRRRVDYVLAGYAGHRAGVHECGGVRVLAMKSPRFMEPQEGRFPTILTFIRELLPADGNGMDQAEIFLAWLAMAVRAVRGEPRAGQLLLLVGKKGDGKGRLQHFIITPLLGGRSADPMPYLLGESQFNSEFFETEHLLSEDPAASIKKDERNKLKQKLKGIAVNDTARYHAKNRPAVTLRPVWRMSMSLNDTPDDTSVLPAPTSDWTEKTIMLATSRPSYLPRASEAERREWREKLATEMPAFLHFLLHIHETPEGYRGDRFGVVSYENPAIRAELVSGAAWAELLAEIEDWRPWIGGPEGRYYRGKLHDIEAALTSTARDTWQSTERLLKRHSLAYLLRQIMAEHPDRISRSRTGTKGGGRFWVLWAPNAKAASGAAVVEAAEAETQPEATDEF